MPALLLDALRIRVCWWGGGLARVYGRPPQKKSAPSHTHHISHTRPCTDHAPNQTTSQSSSARVAKKCSDYHTLSARMDDSSAPAWIALRLPNNNVRARLQAATMDAVGMKTAVVAGNATVPPLLAVPVAALVAATVADTDCDGGALARCCRVGHDSEHCRGHRTKVAPLLWRTGGKVFCFGVWTPPPGGDTHDPMAEAIALYERKERIRKARAKRRRHEAVTSQQPLFIVNKEGNEPSTVARTRQRQDHSEHTAPSEEWTAWLK